MPTMDCREAHDRLGLLTRGGIGLTELALLGVHVKQCPACGRNFGWPPREDRAGGRVPFLQSLLPGLSPAIPSRLVRQASVSTIVARRRIAGLFGILLRALSGVADLCGASAGIAVQAVAAVGLGAVRVLTLAVSRLTWPSTRTVAGFALMAALVLCAPGQLAGPPTPAEVPLDPSSTQPTVIPLEATVVDVPPPVLEGAPAAAAPVDAAPVPSPDAPEGAVAPGALAVPERPPGSAPALPATAPPMSAAAPGPATGERAGSAPVPAEPEPADPIRVPDVIGRLAVEDIGAAERDLAALLKRLGGAQVGRRRVQSSTMLQAVVPRSAYGELSRGLAAMGSWQVEVQRSALPDGVRVTIRLSQPAPPRPGAGSVP